MDVKIRKFTEEDIPYKVKWINNSENNRYLHYDLPLREDKTLLWFKKIKNKEDRVDYTITYQNIPVGIIGLLNIDSVNKKAEYYITLGEVFYKGQGIASAASSLLLKKAFKEMQLNKIYLFTETENIEGQKLFERVGFRKEGLLKEDIIYNKKSLDRFAYGLIAADFF